MRVISEVLVGFLLVVVAVSTSAQSEKASERADNNPFANAHCLPIGAPFRQLTPVDLYASAAACIRDSNYSVALVTFALAGVYGRFDTYRVADETAHGIVGILKDAALESTPKNNHDAFTATAMRVTKDAQTLRELCGSVDAVGYPLYEPTYMKDHGLVAIVGSANTLPSNAGTDPKEMWHNALKGYLNCP